MKKYVEQFFEKKSARQRNAWMNKLIDKQWTCDTTCVSRYVLVFLVSVCLCFIYGHVSGINLSVCPTGKNPSVALEFSAEPLR